MQTIENNLNHITEELHSMENLLPPIHHDQTQLLPLRSPSTHRLPTSNSKLRETLFRIARPFDQQFSLNVAFQHQIFEIEYFPNEDLEERFNDLYRINKNVLQFFLLESELPDEDERNYLSQMTSLSSDLINERIPLAKRIDSYNSCVKAIKYFQPIISFHVQRTDLIDTVF